MQKSQRREGEDLKGETETAGPLRSKQVARGRLSLRSTSVGMTNLESHKQGESVLGRSLPCNSKKERKAR